MVDRYKEDLKRAEKVFKEINAMFTERQKALDAG